MREADRRLLVLLRTRLRHPTIERAMVAYTWTGEWGGLWIGAALAGALVDPPRRRKWLRAAAGVPLTLAANRGLKELARRERPLLEGLDPTGKLPTSLSFPSAHAATSFAGATQIAALAPALRPHLYAAAALMAFSRPYLGLHYPSDVLAGAVVGTLAGAVLVRMR